MGSRCLGQGRVAVSMSRATEQAGAGAGSGQSPSRLSAGGRECRWSGLLPAGWEPQVRQGMEGREGKGIASELQAPLNKNSL